MSSYYDRKAARCTGNVAQPIKSIKGHEQFNCVQFQKNKIDKIPMFSDGDLVKEHDRLRVWPPESAITGHSGFL